MTNLPKSIYIMKKIAQYVSVAFTVIAIICLIAFRDQMTDFISSHRTNNLNEDYAGRIRDSISAMYDYSANDMGYSYTFLEFGSTACSACRQMQDVMKTIRESFPRTVNVVFVNVTQSSSQAMCDYYGKVGIPTQVLLDRNGKEFYRHTGYIPAGELSVHFKGAQ